MVELKGKMRLKLMFLTTASADSVISWLVWYFFFQAEDGIRDLTVTGVQTCALPILSFFTKAVCAALKDFPAVNASVDKDEIIYHDYCDVSIAVSTPRGLVVPVIRNADRKSVV